MDETNIIETMDAHDITLLKSLSTKAGNELPDCILRLTVSVVPFGIKRVYVDWFVWIATRLIEALSHLS